MDNTFRIVGPAQDELLVSRLLVHARATGERYYGGVELQDSRAWLHKDLTPVGTDDVNALEPLQLYAGYRTDKLDVQLGRMTMDVGSRRFVARNRTRNTLNGFTGINVRWTLPGRRGLQAFLTMPTARLPNNLERGKLRGNDFVLDQEHGSGSSGPFTCRASILRADSTPIGTCSAFTRRTARACRPGTAIS